MSSINNRGSIAKFLAPTVWLAGAFGSCVVGLAIDAPTGWLVLAAMAALTLLLARRAIGWRAVPVVATLAALQTPSWFRLGSPRPGTRLPLGRGAHNMKSAFP